MRLRLVEAQTAASAETHLLSIRFHFYHLDMKVDRLTVNMSFAPETTICEVVDTLCLHVGASVQRRMLLINRDKCLANHHTLKHYSLQRGDIVSVHFMSCTPLCFLAAKRILFGLGDDDALCVICMDEPSNAFLVPCGHEDFCLSCAKRLSECPLCGMKDRVYGKAMAFPVPPAD